MSYEISFLCLVPSRREDLRKIIRIFSDCLKHQKKQCFKCSYEKTCDGLSFQQRRFTDCDVMEITEYERLVRTETEALQSKMTNAIDAAMSTIQTKQSELMAEIKSDPRKSGMPKRNIKLVLHISNEKESDGQTRQPKASQRGHRAFTGRNSDKQYIHFRDGKTYTSSHPNGFINEKGTWTCSIGKPVH